MSICGSSEREDAHGGPATELSSVMSPGKRRRRVDDDGVEGLVKALMLASVWEPLTGFIALQFDNDETISLYKVSVVMLLLVLLLLCCFLCCALC